MQINDAIISRIKLKSLKSYNNFMALFLCFLTDMQIKDAILSEAEKLIFFSNKIVPEERLK